MKKEQLELANNLVKETENLEKHIEEVKHYIKNFDHSTKIVALYPADGSRSFIFDNDLIQKEFVKSYLTKLESKLSELKVKFNRL